jgi:hypothetical protein
MHRPESTPAHSIQHNLHALQTNLNDINEYKARTDTTGMSAIYRTKHFHCHVRLGKMGAIVPDVP